MSDTQNLHARPIGGGTFVRPVLLTAGILLIPLLGNMFVDGWNWPLTGFAFFGAVLFSAGLAYEVAGRYARTGVIIGFVAGVIVGCGVIAIVRYLNPEDDVAGIVLLTILFSGLFFALLGWLIQVSVRGRWRLGSQSRRR